MKRKRAPLLIAILLMVCFAGCAMNQQIVTPKDKLTMFMSFYSDQFDKYQLDVQRPDLVQEQKDILKAKHALFQELWDAISFYKTFVDTGSVPPSTMEATINQLMNKLESLVIKEVVQ